MLLPRPGGRSGAAGLSDDDYGAGVRMTICDFFALSIHMENALRVLPMRKLRLPTDVQTGRTRSPDSYSQELNALSPISTTDQKSISPSPK